MEEKTIDYRELYIKEFTEKVELKKQLKNLEEDHELLINDYEKMQEDLRKQIQTESQARKRAIEKIKTLEESKEQVEELIDYVLADNLVNIMNAKQYIDYVGKDLVELQDMKDNNEIDECLYNHLVEELELLKDIITIVKGVE